MRPQESGVRRTSPPDPSSTLSSSSTRPISSAFPAGPDVASKWLKQNAGPAMTKASLRVDSRQVSTNRVTGEQLLFGNRQPGSASPTSAGFWALPGRHPPLDVFPNLSGFRTNAFPARIVGFRVEGLPLPRFRSLQPPKFKLTSTNTRRLCPIRALPTPGFQDPQADSGGDPLARRRRPHESVQRQAEPMPKLLSYYENRKAEFQENPSEFPRRNLLERS